jgi:hypothetical protein
MTSMRHSDSLMSTALSYVQKTRMIGVVLSIYGDGISMRFKQECAESIIAIFSTLGQTLAMTKQPAGAIVDAVDLAAGEVLLAWVLSRNFELPAMIKRVAVFEISYAAKEIAIAMKPCAERDAAGAAREFVEPLERLIRTHPRPLHENIVSAEIKERTEFGISCVEDRMMVEALSDISSAFLRARMP